ncbi:hypothetical protein QQX98_003623 [Neonectria punicea]|uniref:C2H2-type domain-containing protein n=1 Tax=Neonectria punicea TaxID=979145 RepID=A0ABR1HCT7_9HYPO
MDDPKQVFEAALAEFKARASDRQIASFTATTIQHVQVKIITIQRDQEKAKAMMNFNRFSMFLEALKQFDDVTKALDIGIPDLSAYIWGPTKYILNTAKEDTIALDCILTSYCNFGRRLHLIAEYKDQLRQQPQTKICLAWMYQDLLRFNSSLLKLLETNGWRRTFMANWKDYNGPFQTLLGTFDSHERFLQRTLENQQYQSVRETQRRLNDHVGQYQSDRDDIAIFLDDYRRDRTVLLANAETQEIKRKHDQYLDIIHWLHSPGVSEPEKQYQNEFFRVKSEYPDTGKWILEEKAVRCWIEDETPEYPILWIHGKKGAGKTILASLIIHHLAEKKKDFKTSYFYCRENDENLGEQRFLAIMKSLLRQMVGHNRDLLPTLHEKRLRGQEILNDESTAETLLSLFCDTEMNQFIVIDGLDELGKVHRERLVKFVNSVVAKSSEGFPGKVRVLFLSTDLAIMRKSLQTTDLVREYSLNLGKTSEDIKSYVVQQGNELQKKFRLGEEHLQQVQALTCQRSNGMFLYAFLVTENLLGQPNVACVESELQGTVFPMDLKQAYGKIIERLRKANDNTWNEAKKIFGWLAFAKRPLKWHELQAVLSIEVDEQGHVQPANTKRRLCADIQEVCGSLVHMPGGTSIDFIHQTAKEYVLDVENLNGMTLECDLALLCFNYLSHTCFQESLQDDDRESYARMGCYAFQDYAISQWDSHLKSLIENLTGLFSDPHDGPQYRWKTSNAVKSFCQIYNDGLVAVSENQVAKKEEHAQVARTHCQAFEQQDFYAELLEVWTHVVTHQHQSLKERNKVSIKQLGEALKKIRGTLEELAPELENDGVLAGSLKDFYGEKLFKCTRITCGYFYEGFDNQDAAKHHSNRHDRPYPCTIPNCSLVPFGFASNKDLDKHLRTYHPDESGHPSAFVSLDQTVVADAKHQCELCLRDYTRRANLDSHMNSAHLGLRPYACRTCEKAFARNNDRRRHEKLHVRRR